VGTIERFEDMSVWKESRAIVRQIYSISKYDKIIKDFGFKEQFQRAAVSIMSNIAEGFERKSNKEFSQFLFVAKGSAGEVRSLSYVAKDIGYIDEKTFLSLQERLIKLSKQLSAFIKYLRSN
jgi:four helix bundle protein